MFFVSDAQVSISDDLNHRETLSRVAPGIYQGSSLIGTVGRTYTLEVVVDDKRYTARSTMPPTIPIDSIGLDLFFIQRLLPAIYNYRTQNTNSFPISRKFTFSDRFNNGQAVAYPLFKLDITSGDVIDVTLYSVDEPVFEYFRTLDDAGLGNSFTAAAPANPRTNISGGALGYFQAASRTTTTRLIP